MHRLRWTNSVVARLALGFCFGGVVLSVCLGVLEYRQSARTAAVSTAPHVAMLARHMQDVVRPLVIAEKPEAIPASLRVFVHDRRIMAVRYTAPDGTTITEGRWPKGPTHLWTLDRSTGQQSNALDLSRPTIIVAPITLMGQRHGLSMVVDGPHVLAGVRQNMVREVAMQCLLLGVLTLAGLMALRQWFSVPLTRIATLARSDASAHSFAQAATDIGGEFGDLADAVGRMLRRIDEVTDQLRRREQAFSHLFEFAPAAIISIGPDGRIIDANRRAAELFERADAADLHGTVVLHAIADKDRALFRQAIDRLEIAPLSTCELQLSAGQRQLHVALQLAAVRDDSGALTQVRMSLVDVTESRWLMAKVAEHRRLLDLVINHMSDAILLVDNEHRVISANARLGQILNLQTEAIEGTTYDPAEFWVRLEPLNPLDMERRLGALLSDAHQRGEVQLDTRDASFSFQAIPVCDETERVIAQLWVVQEITAQVRGRRLLEQQSAQLQALKQLGQALHDCDGINDLLERAVGQLHELMDVEVTGIALRDVDPVNRCLHLIHPGADRILIPSGATMAGAVASHLLPEVLKNRATSLWPDLAHDAAGWSQPFQNAGLESMAVTVLSTQHRVQGVVWIGRKGGQRINPHHLYLLEAMAPILSTSVDNAQLREHISALRLTDPVTELPSYEQFELIVNRLVNRPGEPWSLMLIDMDHFKTINEHLGHDAADRLLRDIAQLLVETIRSTDQVCRYSEDQFAVISPYSEIEDSAELAERIRGRIGVMDVRDSVGRAMEVSCSIGVAASPADHCDADMLIYLAMQRLNIAKAGGRNRVAWQGPQVSAAAG